MVGETHRPFLSFFDIKSPEDVLFSIIIFALKPPLNSFTAFI